jgi:hypothetical protein
MIQFVPHALPRQPLVDVQLTPHELFLLIEALERRGCQAADNYGTIGFTQYLFCRVATLREAGR